MPQSNKFKDDKGRWRTQSLFLEQSYGNTDDVIYTMKDEDHNGLPSFSRMYLELNDPTEYSVGTQLLGGWDHFQTMMKSKWFSEYIGELREELEIKLRSEAFASMLHSVRNKTRGYQSVAKWLSEGGWKEKKVGRPSNEQVNAEARRIAEIEKRVDKDAERILIN